MWAGEFIKNVMGTLDSRSLRELPPQIEVEVESRHEEEIFHLLPLLGPLFGCGILLFSAWDYLIDPAHAWSTFLVRLLLVLLGSIAYVPNRLQWSPVQRCGVIYGTHSCAIIISEYLLNNGFLYGLTGIAACIFVVSVITLRVRTFLLILSAPTLLFLILSAIRFPLFEFINSVMLYIFSVACAGIVMLVIRYFRLKAFSLEKKLLHISHHDSLTGAYNRGYLTELAVREIALAKRHGRALCVAMIDIDHFKSVNDTYGHAVGDETIKLLVKTCEQNLREIDHFGRIGGEEFVCILPETAESDAMLCAERLRRSIEEMRIKIPSGYLQVTASIGVAVLIQQPDWDALLKDADTALYSAKRDGRNRVVLATTCIS
ncbi:GGDEF domain-containing protein [Solimicrobium silvestre]|uniref:diguanylate cyclase n=1 Tax=Solimicrobium silvestre TaxID=2099400 RepID=A0A2S9H0G5_9BURK|nr:GGDEF domain-containing protein [Solimicrobium silvestre]PRC93475.1 GGDEF: diguanylate cyclase (GGDEF) domain [Solimicrobium silvestre]